MTHQELHHIAEWKSSGIDADIIKLNLRSLSDTLPYEYLLYGPNVPRRNDGRLRDFVLKKYRHTERGGWWCSGVDPLSAYWDMQWGCFKPDKPRRDPDKEHKTIKYEHPYRTPTRAFFLRVPFHIWQRVGARYGVEVPADLTHPSYGGFWHWVKAHNIPVVIVEGVKKAGALLSAGYAAIALPGVNAGYRVIKDALGEPTGERRLIPDLEHFADGRDFIICFDQDSNPTTVKRVNNAINQTARLLAKHDCTCKVVSWKYREKGVDDLFVVHGQAVIDEVFAAALTLEQWQVKGYSDFSYPAALNLNQRYLGELAIAKSEKLICLKAPKGTGKTETLAPIVAAATNEGQPVILLSHRVQLAQAIADRVGIPYITEVKNSETGSLLGFALCVDSLHPRGQAQFNAEHWREPLVIIDESEQVIWHALTASTEVKKHRVEVLKQMTQLFKNALAPGRGKVILADADLSDLSVEFVTGLAGVKVAPWTVLNTWQGSPWRVCSYDQTTPVDWLGALEVHIRAGGKPFIALDGQKAKSKWGTKVLEAHLKKKFPHLRILRIDSESIADPNHPAFGCIGNLNTILLDYDIVICSPSVGTGVSIDIRGHFTSVWGCFQGVTSENAARQALARVRETVERHVWVATYGLGRIGNGAISLKSLLASECKKFQANLQLLQNAGTTIEEEIDINRSALNVWAKMACRINAGMVNYREAVLEGLRAEGHHVVTLIDWGDDNGELSSAIKTTNKELYSAECSEIAATDISEMTHSQFDALKQQRSKTQAERYQERKYSLRQKYGVDVTPDLVQKDDEGYHAKLRLHYYLTTGRNFVSRRDCKLAEKVLEAKSAWLPDFNGGQRELMIVALEKLGILKIISDRDRELRGSDNDLCTLAINVLSSPSAKWQIKTILRVSPSDKDSPIVILRRFLAKLGLELEELGRDGTGDRQRFYKVVGFDDGRDQIFNHWLARDTEAFSPAVADSVQNHQEVSASTNGNKEFIDPIPDTGPNPQEDFEGRICRVAGSAARYLVHRVAEGYAFCMDLVSGFAAHLKISDLILEL